MRMCKIRPDVSICRGCMDMEEAGYIIRDCSVCSLQNEECELIKVGSGFFMKDYAMILRNGKIKKVPLDRIYDIHDVFDNPREKQVP